ncbi:fimbrial protein [Erwinia mallotivora]|uniref:fimbrial protein n=1 Tax=Erwinia mallotivora TaxID=69222 RepID=UPI0021C1730A|nr:fimbrial protein [Erwinia mallotivora]
MDVCQKTLFSALLWLPVLMARASTQSEVFTFTMTADVVESASCTLNDGKDVDVSFGDQVDIARIDGINYQTVIAYNFGCEHPGKNVVTVEIAGTDAGFGQGMLHVKSGLGIRIMNGDVPQPVNTPFSIDATHPPILMAVPVKDSSVTLTPGAFETTATIKVNYE